MAGSVKRGTSDPMAVNAAQQTRSQQPSPVLDRVIQAQIGDKLRAMYGELTEQPVPDRLTAILAQIASGKGRETDS